MEKQNAKKGKKREIVGVILLILFAGITALGFLYYDEIFAADGWCQSNPTKIALLNTILSFAPKLVGTILTLFITLLVLYIAGLIFKKVFRGTPRRTTVGRLVKSIFRVIVWVIAVIAILAVWGINVGALIAGAGVLTLVVGLGMQSLIADVVAGIFLVCDGTLEVGDIVTIDGWRGTVMEIGIRTTKLINYSGDIRVCTNSTITTFINQSREKSYPTVEVAIAYKEDVEKVKKLFEENKDAIKAKLPLVLEGPDFMGVSNLGDSGVSLSFGAYCKEGDFFQVQRDMRGVLKEFFDEKGVEIPFPQIVIHGEKDEQKK